MNLKDTLDRWTEMVYPSRRRQGRTVLIGGCGFWLLVILFVALWSALRAAVWLIGVLMILLWFGITAALRSFQTKP